MYKDFFNKKLTSEVLFLRKIGHQLLRIYLYKKVVPLLQLGIFFMEKFAIKLQTFFGKNTSPETIEKNSETGAIFYGKKILENWDYFFYNSSKKPVRTVKIPSNF